MSGGIFIFIFSLLFIVMVHEAGHLLMAKAFGFKATRFFVGMGPTIWSTQKGETEYGIKALPIGGFVKIVGMSPYEEIAPEDLPRAYPNKPKWQRALVLLGGPVTHWILAFFILVAASMAIGAPTGDVTNKIEVVEKRFLGTELPAAAIDLEPGERIVAVGGNETAEWNDILSYIRSHGGEQATFDIASGGEVERRSVKLGWALFQDTELFAYVPPDAGLVELRRSGRPVGFVPYRIGDKVVGFLGVQPEVLFEKAGLGAAVADSGRRTWELTKFSVTGIGDVFGMVFDGTLLSALQGEGERDVTEGPCGIVCAGQVVGQVAEQGRYLDVIGFIVGFTVFIGLMNLLPLPPLDGGHLAVLAYEAVTRRAVDVRKLIPVAAAVISFFVILFIAVLYLDLARPIRLPF